MTQFADDEAADLEESDAGVEDDLDSQIDWEEDLEDKYGGDSRRDRHRENKILGGGFAKQKELLEKNKGYVASRKKPKVNLIDKTKK